MSQYAIPNGMGSQGTVSEGAALVYQGRPPNVGLFTFWAGEWLVTLVIFERIDDF